MKVLKNGQKVEMTYAEICKDLGFIASAKFVKVTSRGSITFTLGTPDEVRALDRAIEANGYKPSQKFTDTLHML